MSICEPTANELFQQSRLSADGLFSEMIGGRILRSAAADQDGRRLCFLLGTLLADHLRQSGSPDQIIFGPELRRFGAFNIFLTDFLTCDGEKPRLAINMMPENGSSYYGLDKAFAYRQAGAAEYWLIDLREQFVCCFDFTGDVSFRRISFDQLLRSSCYPDFSCCLTEIMLEDEQALQELAVFYRFKKELYPAPQISILSDQRGLYQTEEEESYTADQFYRWIKAREDLPDSAQFAQLLSGNISLPSPSTFRHQYLQGSLYLAVRTFLRQTGSSWQLCFSPLAAEMHDGSALDSVVRPDLFLIPSADHLKEDIYQGVPLWIAEIAEPENAAQTYLDKAQIYSYYGVPEFWIINDWKQQVMVFCQGQEPVLYSYTDQIPLGQVPGLTILPQDIF